VDGGLWQNNPTLVGVYEANNYFVGTGKEYDRIEILSIGNPHSNLKRTISTKNKKSSLKKWGAKIVELPMKVSSIASDQITKLLYANNSLSITNYLRIASNNISIEHQKLCLDFASDKSLSQLKGLADHDFFNQKEKIRKFFGGIPC
jgi:hypothetical protein